ncbi:MAG: glycoside hydrolase family 99-like domain-containing protein [Paludibacter sp.]
MSRVIAFYLPQFHPIPENNEWWGKGFTEWTTVAKAKPLFKGHKQPHIPADLGFYDLRLPETRIAQAEMAKKYGVEGFCYWHYWFGNGKRLLERPFNEVVTSGEPDFPFCLAWANHSWYNKEWGGDGKNKLLIEQKYLGESDYIEHFKALLPAFKDKRYILVDNKPLFTIYEPLDSKEEIQKIIRLWNQLAIDNGLNGIYFVGRQYAGKDKEKIINLGFDAVYNESMLTIHDQYSNFKKINLLLKAKIFKSVRVYDYAKASDYFSNSEDSSIDTIPCILPNWDHTPRSGNMGTVLQNSTPVLFNRHVKKVLSLIQDKPKENQIVFLKSWNEWGEGNYIEPDLEFGRGYLEALKQAIDEFETNEMH